MLSNNKTRSSWSRNSQSACKPVGTRSADFQCRQILKQNYRRIAPVFPRDTNIKLDEWKRSQDLIDFGDASELTDSWSGDDVVQWLSKSDRISGLSFSWPSFVGRNTLRDNIQRRLRFWHVFEINADGTRFTVLKTFTGGADGGNPADPGCEIVMKSFTQLDLCINI
jgi:hypothetical protein